MLLANYSAKLRRVRLTRAGAPAFVRAMAVILDAGNVFAAMSGPESWLHAPPRQEMRDGMMDLPPFAVAWADVA